MKTCITFALLLAVLTTCAQPGETKNYTFKIRKPVVQQRDTFMLSGWAAEEVLLQATTAVVPEGTELVKVDEVVEMEYPVAAKDLEIAGTVYVRYEFDRNGNTQNIRMMRKMHPVLEEAALNYVKNMQARNKSEISNRAGVIRYTIPLKFTKN